MEISRYIFQSPYPNQIQIGRPDPTVKKEDDNSQTKLSAATSKTPEQWLKSEASNPQSSITPTVESTQLLDTYV